MRYGTYDIYFSEKRRKHSIFPERKESRSTEDSADVLLDYLLSIPDFATAAEAGRMARGSLTLEICCEVTKQTNESSLRGNPLSSHRTPIVV